MQQLHAETQGNAPGRDPVSRGGGGGGVPGWLARSCARVWHRDVFSPRTPLPQADGHMHRISVRSDRRHALLRARHRLSEDGVVDVLPPFHCENRGGNQEQTAPQPVCGGRRSLWQVERTFAEPVRCLLDSEREVSAAPSLRVPSPTPSACTPAHPAAKGTSTLRS